MINLLPQQEKVEIFYENRYRLILIAGVSFMFFLISLSLVLFSVKTYISGKVQSEKIVISQEFQDQEQRILKINKSLKDLGSFYKESPDFTGILEKISQVLPSGIYLKSLSLNFSRKEGNFQASLQGFSATRDFLFQLKKNLESEEIFKDIDFPASNWIKPEDINFNVNFKIDNAN